jgi:hypothetical protein
MNLANRLVDGRTLRACIRKASRVLHLNLLFACFASCDAQGVIGASGGSQIKPSSSGGECLAQVVETETNGAWSVCEPSREDVRCCSQAGYEYEFSTGCAIRPTNASNLAFCLTIPASDTCANPAGAGVVRHYVQEVNGSVVRFWRTSEEWGPLSAAPANRQVIRRATPGELERVRELNDTLRSQSNWEEVFCD